MNDINSIMNSNIQKMLNELYNEVHSQLKKYSRGLLLKALGIQMDDWGRINGVSPELEAKILTLSKVEKLQETLLTHVNNQVKETLEGEFALKVYNTRVMNTLINNAIQRSNKEILDNIEDQVKTIIEDRYKPHIQEQIYSNPLIKEIMLKKL